MCLYLSTSRIFTFHPSPTHLQVVGGHKAAKCGRKGQKKIWVSKFGNDHPKHQA